MKSAAFKIFCFSMVAVAIIAMVIDVRQRSAKTKSSTDNNLTNQTTRTNK